MKHFKAVECSDLVNHAASDIRRRTLGEHGGTRRKRYVETAEASNCAYSSSVTFVLIDLVRREGMELTP
jgi:hypothetical protein